MKIGIIGSRGIPNNYGGFEQFAERFSVYAADKGHRVSVYCSSLHPDHSPSFQGVERIIQFDAEKRMGTAGQFVYDLNCILDARKRGFDVLLQLGYTSSSVWNFLIPEEIKVATNMDGMEWKRSKYNRITKLFLKEAEKLAVKRSNLLIADSIAIADYLKNKYQRDSSFIAYGADVFDQPDTSMLRPFGIEQGKYNLLIARMEPENNVEMIIRGHLNSGCEIPLVVVGHITNSYGKYLHAKYASRRILFPGGIYHQATLNNLRHYAHLYFHGHSVGGTNPSLLEAMAAGAFIAAHDNPFNRYVLHDSACYFNNEKEVAEIVVAEPVQRIRFIQSNTQRIAHEFSWNAINQQLLNKLNEMIHVA